MTKKGRPCGKARTPFGMETQRFCCLTSSENRFEEGENSVLHTKLSSWQNTGTKSAEADSGSCK